MPSKQRSPRLAIIRSCSWPLNFEAYNIQEAGLAKALKARGWEVDIFSRVAPARGGPDGGVNRRDPGVTKIGGIRLPGRQVVSARAIGAALLGPYDYIQVHEDWLLMNHLAGLTGRLAGKRVVLWQGAYKDFSGGKKLLQACQDLVLGRLLRGTISIALAKTTAAQAYLQAKGYDEVNLLPVGLDVRHLESGGEVEAIESFRAAHREVLLYVGILEPRRPVGFLLDLFDAVKRQRPGVGLMVVGDGPDAPLLRQRLDSDPDRSILHLPGLAQDRIGAAYRNSDVVLLPSRYEIFGMVLLEALHFGLPVVASPEAGPRDIIADETLGFCPEMEVSAWASAVLSSLNSRSDEAKAVRRAWVSNRFSWDSIASAYTEMVNR